MLWYHIHFLQNAIGTAYFATFNMRVVRLPYALSLFNKYLSLVSSYLKVIHYADYTEIFSNLKL